MNPVDPPTLLALARAVAAGGLMPPGLGDDAVSALAHAVKVNALARATVLELPPDECRVAVRRLLAIVGNFARSAGMAGVKDVFVTAAARARVDPCALALAPVGARTVVLEQLTLQHPGDATADVARAVIDADVAKVIADGADLPGDTAEAVDALSGIAAVAAGLCPTSQPPIYMNTAAAKPVRVPVLFAATHPLPTESGTAGGAAGPRGVGYTQNGRVALCATAADAAVAWLEAIDATPDAPAQLAELAAFVLHDTPSPKLQTYI